MIQATGQKHTFRAGLQSNTLRSAAYYLCLKVSRVWSRFEWSVRPEVEMLADLIWPFTVRLTDSPSPAPCPLQTRRRTSGWMLHILTGWALLSAQPLIILLSCEAPCTSKRLLSDCTEIAMGCIDWDKLTEIRGPHSFNRVGEKKTTNLGYLKNILLLTTYLYIRWNK